MIWSVHFIKKNSRWPATLYSRRLVPMYQKGLYELGCPASPLCHRPCICDWQGRRGDIPVVVQANACDDSLSSRGFEVPGTLLDDHNGMCTMQKPT